MKISVLATELSARGVRNRRVGTVDPDVRGVTCDSRSVAHGDLFVALPGRKTDGSKFVAAAVSAGASAIACAPEATLPADVSGLVVDDLARACGQLAAVVYGDPARRLTLAGVTGTNGKTSCTYLLESMWSAAGEAAGVIGTVSIRWPGHEEKAAMTTPDAPLLQSKLHAMVEAGCTSAAIEVSSHALSQYRVEGCEFHGAIFTNLTRDHLDYHGDEETYFSAKAALFLDHLCSDGVAVLNADDPYAMRLANRLPGKRVRTFSVRREADAWAVPLDVRCGLDGLHGRIRLGDETLHLETMLIGLPNLANVLAAAALARSLGVPLDAVESGVRARLPVPGRLERVGRGTPVVLVDYAHTPDALERTLATTREMTRGRLIVVFGCGGDRDSGKRPIMGRAAAVAADVFVLTSDNPRSEDPLDILRAIEEGVADHATKRSAHELEGSRARGYAVEPDRERAIALALALGACRRRGRDRGQGSRRLPGGSRGASCVRRSSGRATSAGKERRFVDVADITRIVGGRPSGAPLPAWSFAALSTDSRNLEPDSLFVALKGEHFDGNDFIDDAIARGAAVVVCTRGRALDREGVAFIEVEDTLRALGDIAAAHRRRFHIPLVAITGSNGKTTTKELLSSILKVAYGADRVLATRGNLNNLIGLPLTLARLSSAHSAAVVEMGMNAFGEIARMTEIAAPTVGLITCVGSAHLEGVGSIEGVARAKGELFAGLPPDAVAVVNVDDPLVTRVAESFHGRKLGFGRDGDVRAGNVEPLAVDRTRFHLVTDTAVADVEIPLAGRHNVANALAASAAAMAIGIDLKTVAEGLKQVVPPPMRLAAERLVNGVALVNDAYNANPSSLRAAVDAMADVVPERLIVVLGEMLELGERSGELHEAAGRHVGGVRPVLLCALGAHARELCDGAVAGGLAREKAVVVDSHEAAADAVAAAWRTGDLVLVKGSRGAQMERVVEALRRRVAA